MGPINNLLPSKINQLVVIISNLILININESVRGLLSLCSQKERWREVMAMLPVQSPAWWAEPPSFTCFTKIVSIGSRRHRGLPEQDKRQNVILYSQNIKLYYTTNVLFNQVSNTNAMFLFQNKNQMTMAQLISVVFLIKRINLSQSSFGDSQIQFFTKLALKSSRCVHGKYQHRVVYREKT